jgi:hypothetical protein
MLDLMTSQKFAQIIEEIVKEKKISYMDAVVWWCEQHEIEIEVMAKMVAGAIKEKIKYEAQELNYMEKPNRLPI